MTNVFSSLFQTKS